MSSDDSLARHSPACSGATPDPAGAADGFVVVSWWQDRSGDGREGAFEYDHRPTLGDALEAYREYLDGEYARARAIGIFAARNGLPVAGRLEPALLLRLVSEMRRDG